jgi:hypothetical protein
MPPRPAMRLAQNESTSCPIEVTTPRPVITTRGDDEGVAMFSERLPASSENKKASGQSKGRTPMI